MLIESSLRPAPAVPAGAARAGGLALARASASVEGKATRLTLEWRAQDARSGTLALVPRFLDSSGRPVLDAVFPSPGGRRPYPMLWPLVDDLAPALSRGQGLRQVFLLGRAPSGEAARLELDLYDLEPGVPARPLGRVSAPLSAPARGRAAPGGG